MCKCPVAKRNFSKRHGHGILYATKPKEGYGPDRMVQGIGASPEGERTSEVNSVAGLSSAGCGTNQVDFTAVDEFFGEHGPTRSRWFSRDREFDAMAMKKPRRAMDEQKRCTAEALPRCFSQSREWAKASRARSAEFSTRAPLSGLDVEMTVAMMENATLGIDFSTAFDNVDDL